MNECECLWWIDDEKYFRKLIWNEWKKQYLVLREKKRWKEKSIKYTDEV